MTFSGVFYFTGSLIWTVGAAMAKDWIGVATGICFIVGSIFNGKEVTW